jgi:pyruvate dehydrogenase E1 component beta subunit
MKEQLIEGAELPQIGRARVVRTGDAVTLIAYSAMLTSAREAAELLAREGIAAEIIDLRTLAPLDMATIAASISKTHRAVIAHEAVRSSGLGAEIAARIGSELFDELDAPVLRVGCPFAPIPFAPELEQALLPGTTDIVRAARSLLN